MADNADLAPISEDVLPLPFFSDVIPARLPSEDEIIHGADEILSEYLAKKVVRIGRHFLVKYGAAVEPVEAQNMMFVKKTTSIPVPEVYAVFRSQHHDQWYIIMEYVPGATLLDEWPRLSDSAKSGIEETLKGQFDRLRALPGPNYFGGLGKSKMPNGIFWSSVEEYDAPINGPFETEAHLNEALALKSIQIAEYNQRHGGKGEFYRRMLPRVLHSHRSVFTHGDLQRKNIIIQPRGRGSTDSTDRPNTSANSTSASTPSSSSSRSSTTTDGDVYNITLVDWEKAGWYPSYWDYCASSWAFQFDDDWPESVDRILEPWPVEYAWLSMISTELWS